MPVPPFATGTVLTVPNTPPAVFVTIPAVLRPEKVMVPLLVMPVAPVMAPALFMFTVGLLRMFVKVPVILMAFVAVPAVFVRSSKLVVVPPAPFLVIASPDVCVPAVLVRFMVAPLPVLLSVTTIPAPVFDVLTARAVAAPACTTFMAVAAVPLVPLTVRPTTLAAVGVTVFWAVDVGTCTSELGPFGQVPHVG